MRMAASPASAFLISNASPAEVTVRSLYSGRESFVSDDKLKRDLRNQPVARLTVGCCHTGHQHQPSDDQQRRHALKNPTSHLSSSCLLAKRSKLIRLETL